MKNLNALVSVLVLAVISTACGNIQTTALRNSSNNYALATLPAAEQCSGAPNVAGQGYNNDLQNQYRVCANPSSNAANSIKIFAEDQATKNICVYPVRIVGTQIAIYPQYAQCTTTRNTGVSISFANLAANAVYIVDSAAVSQFNACVSVSASGNGSLSACVSQQNIGLNVAYGQF